MPSPNKNFVIVAARGNTRKLSPIRKLVRMSRMEAALNRMAASAPRVKGVSYAAAAKTKGKGRKTRRANSR